MAHFTIYRETTVREASEMSTEQVIDLLVSANPAEGLRQELESCSQSELASKLEDCIYSGDSDVRAALSNRLESSEDNRVDSDGIQVLLG